MVKLVVLLISLFVSVSASAIDIAEIFGLAETPKTGDSRVILEDLTFETDADGTWDTCNVATTGVPCTTIKNRAKMKNYASLAPMFGIDRIPTQQLTGPLPGESGPNGEPVYSVVNDSWGRIRFVGNVASFNDVGGTFVKLLSGSYYEVTFWGTGLNVLTLVDGSDRVGDVEVDSTDVTSPNTAASSSTFNLLNYNRNVPVPLVVNASQSWHTVKVGQVTGDNLIYGFEIVNVGIGSIAIPKGTALINGVKVTTDQTQYVGTQICDDFLGGHVVVYLTAKGEVGSVCNGTGSSPAYLTNANHSDEEVIREYYWREFGVGRNTSPIDFSLVSSASGAGSTLFTLDDGSTSLAGVDVAAAQYGAPVAYDSVKHIGNGDSIAFSFVGTGVDILRVDGTSGGADDYSVYIDGVDRGQLATAGSVLPRIERIASGLSYGSHSVRIERTSASTFGVGIVKFIVYGDKTPAIPPDAIELGRYNELRYSPYVVIGSGAYAGDYQAYGVVSKKLGREIRFSAAGWSAIYDGAVNPSGLEVRTTSSIAFTYVSFFGTGVALPVTEGLTASFLISVSIDDGTGFKDATAVNFPGLTSSSNCPFSPPLNTLTGQMTLYSPYGDMKCYKLIKLPIGYYTFKFDNDDANDFFLSAFDIITPSHIHKQNGPHVVQNALSVGSQSILDTRVFGDQFKSSLGSYQARPIDSNQKQCAVTSNPGCPVPYAEVTVDSDGGMYRIDYDMATVNSTAGATNHSRVVVDGADITPAAAFCEANATTDYCTQSRSILVPLSKGQHTIYTHIRPNTGTSSIYDAYLMNVSEVAN